MRSKNIPGRLSGEREADFKMQPGNRKGDIRMSKPTNSEPQTGARIRFLEGFPGLLQGAFPDAMRPGPGLSFSHSGLSHEEVMARLLVVKDERDEDAAAHPRRRLLLEDPRNGLQVDLEYVAYPAHRAVVYGATLHNGGQRTIEHLRAPRSYDLEFSLADMGDPRLHTIGGGSVEYYYPPLAYRLQESRLFGSPGYGDPKGIGTGADGRSSTLFLPFFFLQSEERDCGLFGGIEWSGLWHIDFTQKNEHDLTPDDVMKLGTIRSIAIQGGMEGVNMELRPGETFQMPRVLLGLYEGGVADGRNRLRRFIDDWGPECAASEQKYWSQGCVDGLMRKDRIPPDFYYRSVDTLAKMGLDFAMIVYWFQERPHETFWASCGSWAPDPKRWPGDELRKLADYIRSKGMKLAFWFDIETVFPESILAREHPEWVLGWPGAERRLLNMALPAVQDRVIAVLAGCIEAYGLKWLYCDNNTDPKGYWDANEPEYRRGRLQHDYIRGVWRVFEVLHERYPDVVIENCSSGGRRIDLGMLARTHRSQSSDQFVLPDCIRYQSSGFSTVLPGNRITTYKVGTAGYSDAAWHANFGGMLSFSDNCQDWSEARIADARKHIEVHKSIQHLLGKDFYPLFPQPQTLREWDGWQYHDPVADEGFALCFRVQSPQEAASPRMYGLCPDHDYVLTDPYTGEAQVLSGRTLLSSGLPLTLPVEGTRLLHYRSNRHK
ncbi:MAG: alpha-galactosidase [Planctomycetes bacterium]|nr:alpha-galactosidase [Planctomycetota bacterium]